MRASQCVLAGKRPAPLPYAIAAGCCAYDDPGGQHCHCKLFGLCDALALQNSAIDMIVHLMQMLQWKGALANEQEAERSHQSEISHRQHG